MLFSVAFQLAELHHIQDGSMRAMVQSVLNTHLSFSKKIRAEMHVFFILRKRFLLSDSFARIRSMISSLASFLLRGLSIYRWSNFPRVEKPTALDHGAFSLHVSFLVADMVEEKRGVKDVFNRLDLFKRSLFSVFFSCAYSDVSSDVKQSIKKMRPDLYATLCKKMHSSVLSWNLPKNVHEEFTEFANYLESKHERSQEADLYSYGKLVSAYYEALFNARVYPEVYGGPLEAILLRLAEPRFAEFRTVLDVTKDTPSVRFLLSVRRLESAFRWNRLRRSYPISVMSHLFIVATLSYLLFRIEGKSDADVTEAILRSLYHDVPEAITGDIVTPTKKAAP